MARRKRRVVERHLVVDEASIAELRARDDERKKLEAEDRRLYGTSGVRRARKLTAAELAAIELVRQRDAGVSGGEDR